jgi:acyl-CoA thioester hydrolase
LTSVSAVRVRYAETDNMGVVYHSNFFVYFEIGRTDYFRQLGFAYKQLEKENVFMPVTDCACRFILPAYYDDELGIHTGLEMMSRLKLKFTYRVIRQSDNKLIAEGFTLHVPVNRAGVPCRIPNQYLEALAQTSHIKESAKRVRDRGME